MATSTMTTEVKHFTGWSVAISVLMIVAGILAIGLPLAAGLAVNLVVAWLLVFAGVGHLWFAWELRRIGGMVWQLLLGVLYIGVGIYLLAHPVAGLLTLTLALAIYLFVEGVLELILAFQLPARQARGWLVLDGIVTLILGFLIWRTWPVSTEWAIGTLVGISMIFSGSTRLMLSLAARKLVNKLRLTFPRAMRSLKLQRLSSPAAILGDQSFGICAGRGAGVGYRSAGKWNKKAAKCEWERV